ncbi:flagellar FlbD family protein [Thermoleophilum album]|jgi:flagellar protein FlbD|uniref:flagellar FlbD family protein n=1 Tax=Thermoleophilum album TaxID=29539 RepID=UPI00237C7EE4|nr:flagellar FlbD family protein [Thermoleophilum album]WDT94571.1 flagellar FlbD family protein [Thermoleophilum album]
MIKVHRVGRDSSELFVNCHLIQQIEACPDTTITLVNGAKVVVAESCAQVIAMIRDWHAAISARSLEVAWEERRRDE